MRASVSRRGRSFLAALAVGIAALAISIPSTSASFAGRNGPLLVNEEKLMFTASFDGKTRVIAPGSHASMDETGQRMVLMNDVFGVSLASRSDDWEPQPIGFSGGGAAVLDVEFIPGTNSIITHVYRYEPEVQGVLYRYDIDTGELTQLTAAGDHVSGFDVTADGKLIYVGVEPAQGVDPVVRVLSAEGKLVRTFEPAYGSANSIAVSPDGKLIATEVQKGTESNIFLMTNDGTAIRQLTDSRAENRWPVFSPDSKQIAFFCGFKGSGSVCTVPVAGGQYEVVVKPEGWRADPTDWVRAEPVTVSPVGLPGKRIGVTSYGSGSIRVTGRGLKP